MEKKIKLFDPYVGIDEERALKKIVRCERIRQANNDPKRQPTGFWGGVLEGLSESGCD